MPDDYSTVVVCLIVQTLSMAVIAASWLALIGVLVWLAKRPPNVYLENTCNLRVNEREIAASPPSLLPDAPPIEDGTAGDPETGDIADRLLRDPDAWKQDES